MIFQKKKTIYQKQNGVIYYQLYKSRDFYLIEIESSYDISKEDTGYNTAVYRKRFILALIKHMHHCQIHLSRVTCDKRNMMLLLRDDQLKEFASSV